MSRSISIIKQSVSDHKFSRNPVRDPDHLQNVMDCSLIRDTSGKGLTKTLTLPF